MPSRQPKKDKVNFIAIKKEKAVTLCPLLPYVYDSYLLSYGCPGWVLRPGWVLGRPGWVLRAVSGSPLTRGVNRSHVLYGSLRRTRLFCSPVAASRACRSRTSRREVADGPEKDDSRGRLVSAPGVD